MLYSSPLFTAYCLLITFLLGLVFGSFGNAWAWRLVHHEKITKGRSHCASCGHPLAAKDLIPLVSYLSLKGRCRYCHKPISRRYILAELTCALLFVSLLLRFDLSLELLRFLILGFCLFVASLVDLEDMWLPDGLLIAGAVAALLRLVTDPSAWKDMLLGAVCTALPLLLLVLIMDKILKKESMGGGDIKLLAVLGLHFGPLKTLLLLILACFIGLIIAVLKKKGRGTPFPFGPALAVAAWITALAGDAILQSYLSLF